MNSTSLAKLLGDWRRESARGTGTALGERISLLIRDGRLPFGTRLPPERELAVQLGISRTTVAGVYDELRTNGHLQSRQGSGTWVTLRDGGAEHGATPWYPGGTQSSFDLTHAALPPPAEVVREQVERAVELLPQFTCDHGYHLFGIAGLREAIARRFTERGLPTHAGQILVTTGAQSALALSLAITLRPGSRVLIDHPTYPNAIAAIRNWGGRPIPIEMNADGWDLERWQEGAHEARPDLLYVCADFHNPTGIVMPHALRARMVDIARLCGAPLVVDETLVETMIDGEPPVPMAAFSRDSATVITIGSLSKIFWGGLRVGWMRASEPLIAKAAAIKASMDMATAVFDQLVAIGVISDLPAIVTARQKALYAARQNLLDGIESILPAWRVTTPVGGMSAWVELGLPVASRLAESCARLGVAITPGSLFGIDGAFEDRIRLPFRLDPLYLKDALRRIALALDAIEPRALVG
ncbi:MAG: PLP-dependent aminotransferase family protein [Proteobacteria bacterium]|nr:PLP-dependent aminotransferase family protein [Pseudomonadota bacterium]